MKILVADPNLVPHRERLEALTPPGSQFDWQPAGASSGFLHEAQVYIGSRFSADMARAAGSLRLIHVAGAGTEKIAFDALPPEVLVANTFHHDRSIAEYVLASAVMLRRGFLTQDRRLRENVWATSVYDAEIPQAKTLRGAHIGFVDFGHIGMRSWKLLRAFGCTVAAVTGSGRVPGDHGLTWTGGTGDLDRLMRDCDVVVVSAPLNEHTRGMIGASQLEKLGPDGMLINVGRGPLIHVAANISRLQRGEPLRNLVTR